MSAWSRLPKEYRDVCEQIAKNSKLSPQNRRVRAAADAYLAGKAN